jgi:membrane associated rhomboid family serine protease
MLKLDTTTKKLIFINVVIYLITLLIPSLIYKLFALHLFDSPLFSVLQLLTYQFIHDTSPLHIIFNMLMLLVFGSIVERDYPGKILTFYIISGLVAGVLHNLTISDNMRLMSAVFDQELTMVGASGAVWGILALFVMKHPNEKLYPFFLPFGFKAKWIVGTYFLIELSSAFVAGDNISHFAHIGGAITGIILYLLNRK